MDGTIKLLRRDWTLLCSRIKETILPLLLITVLFTVFTLFIDSGHDILPIFCGTMFAVSAVQQLLTFLQMDLGGVFPPILILPVKKQTYRRNRYLLALLLILFLFLLMPVLALFIQGVMALSGQQNSLNGQDFGMVMAGYPVLGAFLSALLLPCFLCGEKLRTWSLRYGGPLSIMLAAGGSGFIGSMGLVTIINESTASPLSFLLSPLPGLAFSLVVLGLSYCLVEWYHRRKR